MPRANSLKHPVWLDEHSLAFPPTRLALTEPNGLLAVGGDLSPERLLTAYSMGIFPWFNEEDPILWWSPSPRMIFTPGKVHQSKSLKKHLKKHHYSVTIDQAFDEVIGHCRQLRVDDGTWISSDIQAAYQKIYNLGFAHSIETRNAEGKLIGGLYGIALGGIFFGESMFSLEPNASKIAIYALSEWLASHNFKLIDCQVENPHLVSLGGESMEREQFNSLIKEHGVAKTLSYQPIWMQNKGATIFSSRNCSNTQ
jgi:leucyl/phenylalanyl-tRNA--protein transferase